MPARIYQLFAVFRFLVLVGIIAVTFFHAVPVMAAATPTPTPPCPVDQTPTELGCLPKDPIAFVGSFYVIGLGLIGGVALLFVIVGGYTILTSQGNSSQINVGKSYIFYAIAGLLLAVFGYLFIQVFLIDILNLPGFSES